MRIWLAPSAFFPHSGGVEELTLKLGQHLQRRGHDVLVVVHRHPADLPAQAVVEGLPVRRVSFPTAGRRPGRVLAVGRDHRRVQAELSALDRPDLVHIQCPSNQTLPIALFTRRTSTPLVLTSQGEIVMDADRIYQRSRYLRQSLRFGTRQAAALTACSRWTAEQAARIAPTFATARSVPNGVDPGDWSMAPVPVEPVFCCWGRHVPQKGLDLAIEAFGQARARLPGARLLVGGDGPERSRLAALAGPGVEFLGPLDRGGVRAMLQSARVAIVPSRVEPFGIVALEALAAGRSLVYSRTAGGLPEAVGDRGRGVDPADTTAFAHALVGAAVDPVDAEGNAAYAASFSWDAITEQYAEIYATVIRTPAHKR
ncbi:MAG: glycogen synthase [Actinomycetota bacterium]|jgi:glycosyltransferase involved in cell wall biosynthesis|nr:glycogen synthase [Actinomycetota bacterium]